MQKVQLEPRQFPDGWGYDIVAYLADATIADYLLAVEDFFDRSKWSGLRRNQEFTGWSSCEGCPGCCSERIPLTIGDAVHLAMTIPELADKAKRSGGFSSEDILQALNVHGDIQKVGRVIDVTLRRMDQGQCGLFDDESQRCRYHRYRPMVCRTYFCCPISHRAEKLRLRIVNAGEDELVRQILGSSGRPLHLERGVRPSDYRESHWTVAGSLIPWDLEARVRLEPFTLGLGLVRK
ncbi:hypothetical protein GJ688_06575 [Heliobacillus mobilis]|uniref:YkgJ family cysteine cluster protein n=1 Tax=Heliobacterium mobile TaxID=28064 RepID=A0A6I3SIE0_HELMO|nr:YkgJ family cysteine cluster protein [Heliobacterium mobile]MTV48644.1 hypothetical protein [Heliobacterium mobile]